MTSNCMYGQPHPGDHIVVRGQVGNTVGGLCQDHYNQHGGALLKNGYHFRTPAELMARGEENGGKSQSPSTATRVDTSGGEKQRQPEHEHSSGHQERIEPPSERYPASYLAGRVHGSAEVNRLADHRRSTPTGDSSGAPQELETVASRETASERGLPGEAARPQAVALPEWPQWAEGAGHLTLTPEQQATLMAPFRDEEITIRYDGVVYAPWRRYWSRMVDAFSPHLPSILPIDNPRFQGTEIVVGVVMVVEGKFIGKAWGSHRLEGPNDRMSVGDRIESAISDAVAKIGKRLNMGEDLWDDSYRDYWKSQYAESYTKNNRTYWRKRPVAQVEEHE